ncbi:MAG TPA: hypothetical protein GXX20_09710 [Clostridiaceae bacterium]|nr:hypothetical protein [Clostridiaceae bacterium]
MKIRKITAIIKYVIILFLIAASFIGCSKGFEEKGDASNKDKTQQESNSPEK